MVRGIVPDPLGETNDQKRGADLRRNILVTGATGTIGGAVVQALLQSEGNHHIVAATRNPQKWNISADNIAPVALDFEIPESITTAVQGIDALFLVTGYSVSMLAHSKTVLDAARAAGVRHVVHLGAWSSGWSPFPHLMWHDFVERYVQTSGFSWTHLQPKTFMSNVINGLRPGSTTLQQFYGHSTVGWVDPRDVAALAAASLVHPDRHAGQVYQLAEDALSVDGVAEVLAEVTGLPFKYEPRDPRDLFPILQKVGMEPVYGESLAASTIAIAQGQVADIDKTYDTVQRVLGRPGVTWRDYAQKHRESIIRKATMAR